MGNKRRRKAFTLTELLVVVVVIGVLAAVAVPKFNRVIETRRTAEAESLLSAVRTEQEKRCTFDKPYAESFAKLPGVISVNNPDKNKTRTASANYTYFLDNSGMYAASNHKDYQIKMQSYAAGGLCCEGPYCSSLNKSYDVCGAAPADSCKTEVPGCQNPIYATKPENACECEPTSCRCGTYAAANPCVCDSHCSPGDVSQEVCLLGCGEQKKVCNSSCRWPASWDTGRCSSPKSCSCSSFGLCGTPTMASTCGTCSSSGCTTCEGSECSKGESTSCGECGTKYCSNGYWGSCGGDYDCSGSECSSGETDSTSCGACGTKSRSCSNGYWESWGSCQGDSGCSGSECSGSQTASCGTCGTKTCSNGYWGSCKGDSNCGGSGGGSECSGSQIKGNEACNTCGTRTTHKCENGYWKTSAGTCSVSSASSCTKECPAASKPAGSQGCGNCGTQTRTVTCDTANGTWSSGTWGSCTGEGVCKVGAEDSTACDSGYTGNKKRTCSSSCAWGNWSTTNCKKETCTCYNGQVRVGTTGCNCACPSGYFDKGVCCSRNDTIVDSCGCSLRNGCAYLPGASCGSGIHCAKQCSSGYYDSSAGAGGSGNCRKLVTEY